MYDYSDSVLRSVDDYWEQRSQDLGDFVEEDFEEEDFEEEPAEELLPLPF